MTAQKKLTKEEEAFLAENGFNTPEETSSEDKEALEYIPSMSIKKGRFSVQIGEATKKYDEVELQLIAVNHKYMRRGDQSENFKVIEESVELPYNSRDAFKDTLGTVNCGAVPAYDLPATASAAKKQANNAKGGYYVVVYGLLDGELIRINLPSGKGAAVKKAVRDAGVPLPMIKLKLTLDDATANLEVAITSTTEKPLAIREALETRVTPIVERYNAYVLSRYNKLNAENETAADIMEDEEHLDDEIPF
jgi:hypothetical protein